MSKQITPAELAEIVTKLLTNPEAAGELCESQVYLSFVTDIAQVVCDHCGGEIRQDADFLDEACYVGIFGNDSLPEDGGIWAAYDKDGELFPENPETVSPAQADDEPSQVDMFAVAALQLIPSDTALWDAFWQSTEVTRNGAIEGLDDAISRVMDLSVSHLKKLANVEMCSLAFIDVIRAAFWENTQVLSTGAIHGLTEALRRIAALEVREHLLAQQTPVSADARLWRIGVQGIEERVDDLLHLVTDGAGGIAIVQHPGTSTEQRRTAFLREFLSV